MLTCPSCGRANPAEASFCMGCGGPLGATATAHETRKTVTALFCDLVGSTELGATHDPEVLRDALEAYFDLARSTVERHGGRVEKFIGDAVSAVFGLPVAHEDDALRAVRAGLEIQSGLFRLATTSRVPLSARVGIDTGEVLAPGTGRPLIGDAMNTASRLQSTAAPGTVVIGEATRRLVRERIVAERLESVVLKGKPEPVVAYRVVGMASPFVRAETPLVGRTRQLRMLSEALDDVTDGGAPVLVTVLAPPGVGKSRLATAFAEAVVDRATVLISQTPSYGDGVTFAPLVELLAQAAGLPSGDADDVAAGLRGRLTGQADGGAVADRLAQLLGVGEARGADAAWAVRRLLEVLAGSRPLVVILEDVHWCEPPMLDLVDAVIERIHGHVLFLCLARPELLEQRPGWAAGNPRATTTTLPPLSRDETQRVAELLIGDDAPESVVDLICDTAEGNPLYLEQLTAMLQDQGLLRDGRWQGGVDVELEIPQTLRSLLAARIDRLDPRARLLLERASVEGRRFRTGAVQALAPELEPGVADTLIAALDRSGLVQPEDEVRGRWRFAHALIFEATYRGLPKALRAELHERLADWMAVEDADQADVDESVARHLERALHLHRELGARDARTAVLSERAGERFAAAGSHAFDALDYITASDLLDRAVSLLPVSSPRRLDLLPDLGAALADSGRYAESDARLAAGLDEARAAGSERGALRATVQLISNLIYHSTTEDEVESAMGEALAALATFGDENDEVGLAEAALAADNLCYLRGRMAEAQHWCSEAIRFGLVAGLPRLVTLAAGDLFGIAVLGPHPFDELGRTARELLARGDPISASVGHALEAASALAAGDEPRFREHEARRLDVLDRHGLSWLAAVHGMEMSFVEISVGRFEAAESRLRDAREILLAAGNVWYTAIADGFLCEAVAGQDRPEELLRLADAWSTGIPVWDRDSQIKREIILARCRLIEGKLDEAEALARSGLLLAEQSDAVHEQVGSHLALADVLDAQGRDAEALAARVVALERLRAKRNLAAAARVEELVARGRTNPAGAA